MITPQPVVHTSHPAYGYLFAKGAGGHAPALEVAEQAARHGVRRLVFAHIGRPTITALDTGHVPPSGEIGAEGAVYTPGARK